jgi:thioesterase domain-containing protein
MTLEDELLALDAHYRSMPPVAAMAVTIAGHDGGQLRLRAPLARNVNDKGCAFGGSLVSLMTLAGWGLVTLRCAQLGIKADVFVADSTVRYLAPLYADLEASARLEEGAHWSVFDSTLRARGRARVAIAATVPLPAGGVATTLQASYAAIARG